MTVSPMTCALLVSTLAPLVACGSQLDEGVDVLGAAAAETASQEVVSAGEPDAAPEVASVVEDVVAPDAAEEVASAGEPDVAPEVTPSAAPDVSPEVTPPADPDVSPEVAPAPDAPVQILSLGDSYTIGSGGVPEPERWPNLLADLLASSGLTVEPPQILAQIGWTTTNLLQAMDAAALEGDRDLVTLLIGVNNQYQGKPIDAYRVDLVVLLERAVSLAGDRPGRVLLVSIPDYGVTPFAATSNPEAISAELDAFNAVGAEEAAAAGVHWIDIVDISRQAATDLSLLAPDGLHPSGAMYALWAERVAPVALTALASD